MTSSVNIGETFGELTVERQLPSEHGNRRWFCRCDCGGEAIRTTSALLESRRDNQNPCCAKCLRELRAGFWIEHTVISASRFKALWDSRGELWSNQALNWIEEDVREEVGLELGGWREVIESVSVGFWDYAPDPERPVDGDLPTLKEIGKHVPYADGSTDYAVGHSGLTTERVRQIEASALGKLRNPHLPGHHVLKRFHDAGIPAGIEGLDEAHDSYTEPEPIVHVPNTILDRALAKAIVGKKNDQRPAWCGLDESPEEVSTKRRAEHMALIDAAIVRAQVWEERRRELLLREKTGQEVGVWEWWGIPGTMRSNDEPSITEALRKIPKPPRCEKGRPPETWLKRFEEALIRERGRQYDYRWSWYESTTVKPLFFIPVPPIIPPVPRRLTGIAAWIEQQVKERS